MDAVIKFGWPTMKVSPLDNSQKMEILKGYLEGIYGKTLSQDQKEMIVEAKQTNNPLYLRSLLDEVSFHGNHCICFHGNICCYFPWQQICQFPWLHVNIYKCIV